MASGLAEFFDLDVSLVRILWVLSIFVGGMGILLYIVMAIIVPLEPEYIAPPAAGPAGAPGEEQGGMAGDAAATGATSTSHTSWHTATIPHHHPRGEGSGIGMTFFGALLIIFGALALIDAYLPEWADGGRFLWPAFILGIGALLVATAIRRRPEEQ